MHVRASSSLAAWLCAAVLVGACSGTGAAPEAQVPAPRSANETGAIPAAEPGPRAALPAALVAQATSGVTDPELRALLVDHWEWTLERSPVWATSLGDHRFDDRIADVSFRAVKADRAFAGALLDRARKLDRAAMARADQITLDLLIGELEADVAAFVCDTELWSISAQDNPVSDFNTLPEMHKVVSISDADHYATRVERIAGSVDDSIANLRAGLGRGLTASAESIRRTIALIDGQLATPLDKWPLMRPATEKHSDWTAGQVKDFATRLRAELDGQVRAAFSRYRTVLSEEILPHARGPARVGLGALPRGAACYRARIFQHTSLHLTPKDLHDLGKKQLEGINREMAALGKKLFGKTRGKSLAATLRTLRTDRSLYFDSREQILTAARNALDAAKRRIPDYFGRLPEADCRVVPVPAFEAPFTTIAYYREPHADGSQPGQYFVNTYKPQVRPRYELAVLTFHESIPGHHLQIALAQEQEKLPAFRRYLGTTAFVEGWGLYSERLADEMGLYESQLDRMGMLSFDAWRASRLVVDTGIHAMGWTRAKAETFMREHTALTDENIKNEVDRYIGWPGQALAYKVGQLEIFKLRAEAEKTLGDHFQLPAFHDVVLGSGAVSLPVLRDNVERWIARESRSHP